MPPINWDSDGELPEGTDKAIVIADLEVGSTVEYQGPKQQHVCINIVEKMGSIAAVNVVVGYAHTKPADTFSGILMGCANLSDTEFSIGSLLTERIPKIRKGPARNVFLPAMKDFIEVTGPKKPA